MNKIAIRNINLYPISKKESLQNFLMVLDSSSELSFLKAILNKQPQFRLYKKRTVGSHGTITMKHIEVCGQFSFPPLSVLLSCAKLYHGGKEQTYTLVKKFEKLV